MPQDEANRAGTEVGEAGSAVVELDPVAAAFQMAIDGLQDLSRGGLLDEETLTAAFLGAIRVAIPAAPLIYGSGSADLEKRCSWGVYKKSARYEDGESEAANGADFALVLWESNDHARVGIFQAKKVEILNDIERIDIHRSPSKPSARRPQLVMIAVAGLRLLAARAALTENSGDEDIGAETREALPSRESIVEFLTDAQPKTRRHAMRELSFIHFFVHRNGDPECVPLPSIPSIAIDQEFSVGTQRTNYVELEGKTVPFRTLISNGLDENHPATGWLRVSRTALEAALPALQSLMPVHSVSGKGGGLVTQPDIAVETVGAPSSPQQMLELRSRISNQPQARHGRRAKHGG